jgi:hypothetical protein
MECKYGVPKGIRGVMNLPHATILSCEIWLLLRMPDIVTDFINRFNAVSHGHGAARTM